MLWTVPSEISVSKRSLKTPGRRGRGCDRTGPARGPIAAATRLGNRELEEDLLSRWRRVEGGLQGESGGVGLSVEELAADLMLTGQFGHGFEADKDLQGHVLPRFRQEAPGGTGRGTRQWDRIRLRRSGGDVVWASMSVSSV